MSRSDFDELVGAEVPAEERTRLRRVHDLLVQAGPPPELPPHLEAGPTLAVTLARPPRRRVPTRKVALLAAALCVLALAFVFGYLAGNNGSLANPRTLSLKGTALAPNALASLRVYPADRAGNWPMKLSGMGLPKLGPRGYYEVFLVRDGEYEPCGAFVVRNAGTPIEVTLNAPYRLDAGDRWVITRQQWGDESRGPIVLRPQNA
ncbi:MAG TPA: hypothetical protein VFL60_03305 [Gaiellaceae bacterium]|nr:hypothetical protein [Gaiellaceae bacterium]